MVQNTMNKIKAGKWARCFEGYVLSVKESLYVEDIFEVNLK